MGKSDPISTAWVRVRWSFTNSSVGDENLFSRPIYYSLFGAEFLDWVNPTKEAEILQWGNMPCQAKNWTSVRILKKDISSQLLNCLLTLVVQFCIVFCVRCLFVRWSTCRQVSCGGSAFCSSVGAMPGKTRYFWWIRTTSRKDGEKQELRLEWWRAKHRYLFWLSDKLSNSPHNYSWQITSSHLNWKNTYLVVDCG